MFQTRLIDATYTLQKSLDFSCIFPLSGVDAPAICAMMEREERPESHHENDEQESAHTAITRHCRRRRRRSMEMAVRRCVDHTLPIARRIAIHAPSTTRFVSRQHPQRHSRCVPVSTMHGRRQSGCLGRGRIRRRARFVHGCRHRQTSRSAISAAINEADSCSLWTNRGKRSIDARKCRISSSACCDIGRYRTAFSDFRTSVDDESRMRRSCLKCRPEPPTIDGIGDHVYQERALA